LSSTADPKLTVLLNRASQGDADAADSLLAEVYPELRRIAAQRMRFEPPGHALQPTALVNEAWLRLFGATPVAWQDRAHFFAVAARQMRFILIEYARKKPPLSPASISLIVAAGADEAGLTVQTDEDLLALDEALQRLEAIDKRAAQGVELRFFGGLTQQEVAEVQQIDVATVKRDWIFAKSWLYSQLNLADPN
jgi:RNA polymerase sigma factor (TIGR02999 family)